MSKAPDNRVADRLLEAARQLRRELACLKPGKPVTHIYNPLEYAWSGYEAYIQNYANGPRRVVFLGMNPGPFGMVQTGVPFGEVKAVRNWLKISVEIGQPSVVHPKRPVLGLSCPRSEISGQRLWGLFAKRFGTTQDFFREHFVFNYCPLAFMGSTGLNITPDKLPKATAATLSRVCDRHLRAAIGALEPRWLIGIGGFATQRATEAIASDFPKIRVGQILHPSPACPAANRDWAGTVTLQLRELGVW